MTRNAEDRPSADSLLRHSLLQKDKPEPKPKLAPAPLALKPSQPLKPTQAKAAATSGFARLGTCPSMHTG